ncbi:MAG: betaine-aldehyde dehydrogenase [Chloroflexota bacterium]|nr:betaine-aldehyde dehydrogenase [Chloroflexota bacterium]
MSGTRVPAVNPATSERLGEFEATDARALDEAVDRAAHAAAPWAGLGPRGRRAALRRLADAIDRRAGEIALLDARDSGNALHSMQADVAKAVEYLHYFAEIAGEAGGRLVPLADGRNAVVSREPFGVVGVITAYNHPFYFSISKSAAALAAGNVVVIKPPEQATLSSLLLRELAADTLPAGVLTVAPGEASTGELIVGHPGIPRISFTGGQSAGRMVLAAAGQRLKIATVELGGKNAFVACGDVDVAATAAAAARSLNLLSVAGQSCSSTSVLFAHESVHDELVAAVCREFERVPVDLPERPGVHMGCLISTEHRASVHAYVEGAIGEGADLVTGGHPVDAFPKGAFYPPTLLSGVRSSFRIAREEVFGPVMAIISWSSEDELVAAVNSTGYGMTANVWSADERRAWDIARRLTVGYAWINAPTIALPVGLPFGGVRNSGTARDHSIEELQSFTYLKVMAPL